MVKNPSKNGIKIEVHVGIDFWSILARFGDGFGGSKPTKNRSKNRRKNDLEKMGAKRGQEAQQDVPALRASTHLGPAGGGRERVNPPPGDYRVGRTRGKRGLEGRWAALNHRSPKGWWDLGSGFDPVIRHAVV